MNILIINHYAGSPEMGMEFRPYYFAKEWTAMGHRVDIIAADFSHLRRVNPEVSRDFQEEVIDGIHYHWIRTRRYEGNGAQRAITMAQFIGKLWLHTGRIIKDMDPDVVIDSSTYPLDTYIGQRIRKKSKKKVKVIHEVHDMWPATLIEIGGMSKYHPFVIAMQIGENSAYKNSDHIVSLPPLAKPYMIEHGMEPAKFNEIPNGVVLNDWENPQPLPIECESILDAYREDGKFIVGYFGGHALSNALDVLIRCAEQIKDETIQFVLVGDGVEKQNLIDVAKQKKLRNITFLDPVEKKAIPTLCEKFDIIYLGSQDSPLYRFGISMNKLTDGLMAGKPIICAITTSSSPVSKYSCGITVKSNDVDGILLAIGKIKHMSNQELQSLRERSISVARRDYAYNKLALKFEKLFYYEERIMKEALLKKIETREIKVAVIGLGYVGLPLAVEKAKAGFKTIGFDVQEEKVNLVNEGHNYIGDVVDSDLKKLVEAGMLSATTDFSFVKDVDFIAICVPTPLDKHQQPDISCVKNSTIEIAKYMTKGTMVVLESTTYPGTTEELIKPLLEEGSGLKCGEDFYLGFSPERVDPGNKQFKTKNTPKVVGAIGKDATETISAMYRAVLEGDVYEVSSPAVAEMEKILENTYRNINIGLVNELAILCDKMGISLWEVIDAAKTKPYGFQAFYPGPGLGGHCIPLDPYYLSWKAREFGFHTSMIESSMMINDKMPEYCVERAMRILNAHKKALNGAKVLVLGIAYKQDIDDYRESPALRVIEVLKREMADVDFYDPWISEYKYHGEKHQGIEKIDPEIIASYDLIMVTAAHTNVDYDMIQKNAKAIFDTKNVMKNIENRENIEVL